MRSITLLPRYARAAGVDGVADYKIVTQATHLYADAQGVAEYSVVARATHLHAGQAALEVGGDVTPPHYARVSEEEIARATHSGRSFVPEVAGPRYAIVTDGEIARATAAGTDTGSGGGAAASRLPT